MDTTKILAPFPTNNKKKSSIVFAKKEEKATDMPSYKNNCD